MDGSKERNDAWLFLGSCQEPQYPYAELKCGNVEFAMTIFSGNVTRRPRTCNGLICLKVPLLNLFYYFFKSSSAICYLHTFDDWSLKKRVLQAKHIVSKCFQTPNLHSALESTHCPLHSLGLDSTQIVSQKRCCVARQPSQSWTRAHHVVKNPPGVPGD